MLISLFRVTSWFDTVYNILTRWVNLEKTICMIMNYNHLTAIFRSILTQILCSSGIIYNFCNLILKNSQAKIENIYFSTRNVYILAEILSMNIRKSRVGNMNTVTRDTMYTCVHARINTVVSYLMNGYMLI